ncbi:MAG: hypothetical protein LBG90_07835 [Spirochaetaceae bacterium]|jgi:hypothetical protein|nr:hypothetical protein [Spirochaetaceae bacterium]
MCFSLARPISPLLILKETEKQLVESIEAYLSPLFPEECSLVKERFTSLQRLGDIISEFPSVNTAEVLRGESRDSESLMKTLSHFASVSYIFHIPTRVSAVRMFLVAKYNAFSMLHKLVKDIASFHTPVRDVLFSIICTLMSETVYFSCLEDPSFSRDLRMGLANDLINFWETGSDPRGNYHIRALETLWLIRDKTPPSFGTMEGASELIRISMDMDKTWQNFVTAQLDYNETRYALEEFLFGLTYEEIEMIRAWLSRLNISAVGEEDIHYYLEHSGYGLIENADMDPRVIYNFFIDRRDKANSRKWIAAPGPKKTLEELYLKYLITQDYTPSTRD